MSNYKIFSNIDGLRDMTEAEKTHHDKFIAKLPSSKEKKLDRIKIIRLEKVKKFLEKKHESKTKTLKRKNQRKNKKLGTLVV